MTNKQESSPVLALMREERIELTLELWYEYEAKFREWETPPASDRGQ